MATPRPRTPSAPHNPAYANVDATDFAGNPSQTSPLQQTLQPHSQRQGRFEEDFDARTRGSSVLGDVEPPQRSPSRASMLNQGAAPSRSGTLKKRSSVKRSGSLKRSGSKRSQYAGSIRGVSIDDEEHANMQNSVFYTPVPTSGSPTEILANRFQAWRKLIKDLIAYFREVSASYEHRAKALLKVSNVINNTIAPSSFMLEGGLNDANRILRDHHKQAVVEANKARDIENEVINQLTGLRADLGQKIKEIRSLSGDFKNSVEKEKETTRKCVAALTEALTLVDSEPTAIAGKGDPYVVRLGVDRQVERQIDEENYLHRAYLNLENSGRELESIVVGEIQRAYNTLASIFKREADEMYSTVERLREGPVGMPKDREWNQFVLKDPHFVNPNIPMRRLEDIEYPGKHHPATAEVRAGMLERKSKYLKSYTPGWYVLSPTHLHEFKSADRIYTQPPVMSLFLPEQQLGTHSQPGKSSHKFVLKGRQTGGMHRGHTWVFRAETYDTMLAWYDDIKSLTEKSGEERNAFVRHHVRSRSQGSIRSVSSDGVLDEDEADRVPYAGQTMAPNDAVVEQPQRPSPGGRFPSDIQVDRHLHAPLAPSSGSSDVGNDLTTASGGMQVPYRYPPEPIHRDIGDYHQTPNWGAAPTGHMAYEGSPERTYAPRQPPQHQDDLASRYQQEPAQAYQPPDGMSRPQGYNAANLNQDHTSAAQASSAGAYTMPQSSATQTSAGPSISPAERPTSNYGDWMAPAAGGMAAGALAGEAYNHERGQSYREEPWQPPNDSLPATQGSAGIDPSIEQSNPGGEASMKGGPGAGAVSSGERVPDGVPQASPGVMRHDTDMSLSDLHVPGKYPRVTGA
ncbi:hypothetical protein M011DRAFT_471236 [Sporormia fimetaria CBS 119925]|uniref:PH domain-containing protein n=1 Tax=Sporormia fimetaria CBS 119925 TaxID=1340428 RepID=A0A6A6V316_9PLEO|nr:hypothetical protein M011DRAFT_471236 [Sporormia fimetaria CBS 119925]